MIKVDICIFVRPQVVKHFALECIRKVVSELGYAPPSYSLISIARLKDDMRLLPQTLLLSFWAYMSGED